MSDYIEVPKLLNHFTRADLNTEWTTIFNDGPEEDLTATYGIKSKRITGDLKSKIVSSFTSGWVEDEPQCWIVETTADTSETEVQCTIGDFSIYAPISSDSFNIVFSDQLDTTITIGPNPVLVTSRLYHTRSENIGDACLIITLETNEDWTTIKNRVENDTFVV